ncbi:MAG: tRNA1(Val) (adenine(37)-N6)-methyltransferase [Christensenellaceae bacterium]|nr:tRNA1(Val) (adenine(37)-N6)-methyltransferase [Christensenellaceae bacterium]
METVEDLQFKGLKLIQNDKVFRFGTDAVLLAAVCDVGAKDRVADLGTGSGIIPILLYGRTQAQVVGLEIQSEAYELARRNVEINAAQDRVSMVQGDLRRAKELLPGRFTAVVCNPPYDKEGAGAGNRLDTHKNARLEALCCLDDVAAAAASLLQTGGDFYMIHRAARLAEVMAACSKHRLEPKLLRLVAPRADREPGYMLLKAKKDARPGMRILPTLLVEEEGGGYTAEMKKIYHQEEQQ